MTFDEIFQQYVAEGFTKPVGGVSGIETLAPIVATPVAPISTVQESIMSVDDTTNGGDRNGFIANMADTTTNAGIMSLSDGVQSIVDLYSSLPTPMSLAVRAIQNIQDPYKDITGALNTATQAAITRDEVRDLQDRIDNAEFGSINPTDQDARRGGQYDGGGNNDSSGGTPDGGGRDAGMGGAGYF